jgi:uncharacterized protein involved in exopolysaccharide biosynthesis/Mrp family chromosome partitioning ATPase
MLMRFGLKKKAAPKPVAAEPEPVYEEASLGTIARALWRNKHRIVFPTILMAAAAFIGVSLLTPRFKSEARVLVEGRENIFLRPEAEKTLMDRGTVDAEAVTSQVQLVLSRDLAREVINKLNLAELPEFNAALNPLSPMTALRALGLAKDPAALPVEERVLSAFFERLSAYSVDKSRVIAIEFQSADPELAAKVANTVAETYLTLQQVVKQDQARAAGQWLSGELEKLRTKVSEAEAKVEAFRAKSNLFVGTNNTTLSGQQLTELNTQLSAARAQKADAEARARLIRDQLRSGQSIEASEVANSDLIRRLSEQRVTLRAQLAEQSSTLLPQHPRIRELRAQVADLDQQIRTEGERLARSLENDAKVAEARFNTLTATLDQLKVQQASNSDQDVQLRALEREAKAQRDLFESYLAKYREASARDSIAAAPADARIISRAVVSNVPYFPKKMPIMLIAALGTFCLTSAFVVTGALLNSATFRPRPLEIDTTPPARVEVVLPEPRSTYARTRASDHLPPAAQLPEVPPETALAAPPPPPQRPKPVAIDDVATAIRNAGESGRRIAVIGAGRNTGTTLTAIALARSLARHARVVAVDLSVAAPNLDAISADLSAPGLAELIRGQASFGDIITKDRSSRLHLVSTGQFGHDASSFLGSHMLGPAIDALAQSYDYLVIDTGDASSSAISVAAQVAPRAILVAGDADEGVAGAARDHLRETGFADVTVLTGPPPKLDRGFGRSAAA